MSTGEAAVIDAAISWAHAMEPVAEAEEKQRQSGPEIDAFESAELALYEAVLARRAARH